MLDEFHRRAGRPELEAEAIASRLGEEGARENPHGVVNVFGARPAEGQGTAGGFKLMIEDHGNVGIEELDAITHQVAEVGSREAGLEAMFTSFRALSPWLNLQIDCLEA